MTYKILMLPLVLTLTACGGSSSSPSEQQFEEVTRNVALASNGATTTATYDVDGASYLTDGDTTASYFWAGNIADDSVTVDFGQVAALSQIVLHTNTTSYNSSNPAQVIEISVDGSSWSETANYVGGVECAPLKMGSGKIDCTFESSQQVRYIRVTINSGSVNLYEFEATGIVSVPVQ